MKKIIIMFVVGLLTQQVIQAQGTVYVSNLNQVSTGSEPVGSDSWLAAQIHTGNNVDGYELDSIQLALTGIVGDPSGFTIMLYTAAGNPSVPQYPGVSLGTLTGSIPSAAGTYTFTPTANLLLSAGTAYFIVLTAGTSVASGNYYNWSFDGINSYADVGGWGGVINFEQSSDGVSNSSSWPSIDDGGAQYAITATAVPEPGVLSLVAAGSLCFLWRRRETSSC